MEALRTGERRAEGENLVGALRSSFVPPAALDFGFEYQGVGRMKTNEAEPIAAIDPRVPTLLDTRGKHWILAEVKRLEQEARFLEKELEELDKMDKVSASLPEFLRQIESCPDPLLLETTGHISSSWDRWFEGPQDAKGCRCWIL